MNSKHTLKIVFWITTVASLLASFFGALLFRRVEAQTAPFLVSPYYGTTAISQGYSADHQAYDFGLTYVAVLAGGEGTIGLVDWYNDNCHHYRGADRTIGLNCGYGLYLRINHTNGYRTIYAHLSATAHTAFHATGMLALSTP
jgi:murein DD-endopeptidase MepM/ murein hydrolase activator NlpD